ncbi:phosphatase PAP2 family protein [Bradyrhizobium sp. 180]|uniref:phosphatase PAP2 family protein n=1 Tax=unclassified Bradyrhizobium TaxID=2631580 RepID=UPI001FFA4FDF|nr:MULTISPECIES: phosphatase PAP2 family protein [unclassified Bradyrhizobium]MCK1422744.1 phosphatase PAP2 family protein [Bradyrhizobium sp. CW12]MCK1493193.1 phosphatase PAP2 family protein [Bradyrhizobium sp. 180]MCK1527353.1 phosphatase PAP2 family protein [Bradyrhizobium sp. 182]MCK1599031.1 phosphatase PAP2 family protein [Bradyrhizobium sp. 164]MCK1615493.1 phosphatase PAP2 family protein [Bradyrhizobium sp. 159]
MALVEVKPTRIDQALAHEIADNTNSGIEQTAQTLTWAADEHVMLALAAAGWLYAQLRRPEARSAANHVLAVSVATAVLPHLLKSVFDQTRPDRLTLRGHLHGIPISGKPRDAFPSGHALHMGALASAAGLLAPAPRRLVRSLAVALSLTRVAVLAHWASDVVAGFTLGIVVERLFRPFTFGKSQRQRHQASRVGP